MVQIMAKTGYQEAQTGDRTQPLPPPRVEQAAEHHLGHVECVPPVVIENLRPVVFLDSQNPPTQGAVVQAESLHEVKVVEHSD